MPDDWVAKFLGIEKPKRRWPNIPHYRDSVYRPEHGSGYISEIDWHWRTITVIYADKTITGYSFEDFQGAFTNQYGGIWVPDY